MNQVSTYDPETGELPATTGPSQSMVSSLVKAEIDTQVATAHAYPRSVARVIRNVQSLVTVSEEAAEECNYALPRGGKPITGPSIRLAEIVAGQWGNCRVGARVVHVDKIEKFVEAEGVFHDLETNTATTARVRRRIVDRNGRLYNDDMIVVTGNAACSIAKRNAILGGVPKAVWNEAYQVALRTIKGDVKTLPERRDNAFKQFAAFGVKPEQIYAALDVGGADDVTLEELATLGAMLKAIRDGEQTVEDYFPAQSKGGPSAKGTSAKLAEIAGKGDKSEGDKPKADSKAKASAKSDDKAAGGKTADKGKAAKQDEEGDDVKTDAGGDQDDDGDEAPVTDEQVADAHKRGQQARKRGMPQRACPDDCRANQRLFDAWNEGWEEAGDGEGQ